MFTPSGDNLAVERHSGSFSELRFSTLTMSYLGNAFCMALVAVWLCGAPALADGLRVWPSVVGATEVYQQDRGSGLALNGIDPVTYFLPEGPAPGRPNLELIWSGVAWRFVSRANRAAFARDPTSYAPRIGGYDAQAASLGRIVDANPAVFVVAGQRLYLFRSDASRTRFLADEGGAARGEERWQELKASLVRP